MNLLLKLSLWAVLAISSSARAQVVDYPSKPIRMILPAAPGGGGDMLGRMLAEHMSKRFNQPFVVENNAAAAQTIAMTMIARAKPDGYTIGLGTFTALTLAPAVYPKLPYDAIKDLTTIARIGTSPIMLLAANDLPVNGLKEFIAYAKASPEPVQYGTWGLGSTGHFCAEVISQQTGIKQVNVPYKGTTPVMTALLSGEIKVGWLDTATGTAAVRTGKIKPLAMCTRRTANFPNIATLKEQGVDFDQWTGWTLMGPAGLPKPILAKLADALKAAISDPAIAARMLDYGITPEYLPGEQQHALNLQAIEVWRKVARDANMKLE